MSRPLERDYNSFVSYSRELEKYCDGLEKAAQQGLELLDRQWKCSQIWSLEEAQDAAEALKAALKGTTP